MSTIDQLKRVCEPRGNALFLGLCFPQGWMFVVSQRMAFDSMSFQLAFHLGMFAVLVALALLFRAAPERGTRLLFHPVGAAALCLVPLFGLLPLAWPDAVAIAVGAVGGVGMALAFSAWFLIYSSMRTKDAFSFTLLGFSGGALLCLVMSLLSLVADALALVTACVLPVCSAVCARRAWEGASDLLVDRPAPDAPAVKPARGATAFIVVQVVVYAVIFGNGIIFSIMQEAIPASAYSQVIAQVNYLLRAVLPLILFVWLLVKDEGATAQAVVNSVLLAVVFLLFVLWFALDAGAVITYVLLSLARNLVLMLLYLALIKLAKQSAGHPCTVFGVGRGVYELFVAIGIVVYQGIVSRYGELPIAESFVEATALCVFVFLVGCFFLTVQNLQDPPAVPAAPASAAPDQAPAPAPAQPQSETAKWDRVREEFALTDREFEVAQLLYRGHTKKGIADILVLSENTVRWYTKQLYVKLDIHSREELICLVDARADAPGA